MPVIPRGADHEPFPVTIDLVATPPLTGYAAVMFVPGDSR
jgi:hypothetical protein